MESEDLFSDEILDWLQDYDDEISADIELLLARASDVYESSIDSAPQLGSSPPERCAPSTSSSLSTSRFAPPKTDAEVASERRKGVPKKTLEDTKYCLNLWEEWRKYRQQTTGDAIAPLSEMTQEEVQHWLTRFILEVRKKDGSVYPPNTLYHICCGLTRHLKWT